MTEPDAASGLRRQLAERGFELLSAPSEPQSGRLHASAGVLRPFSVPPFGTLYALVPVAVALEVDPDGRIVHVDGGEPAARDLDAVQVWLEDLVANNQLEGVDSSAVTPRATHVVFVEGDGRRVVRRKGFRTAV